MKSLLQQKFAGKQSAEVALNEYETDPMTWEAPLKQVLMQVQDDQDEVVIKVAERLMTLVNPQQAAMGKYNVQVTGNVQGLIQGEQNTITMNFS